MKDCRPVSSPKGLASNNNIGECTLARESGKKCLDFRSIRYKVVSCKPSRDKGAYVLGLLQ